MWLIQPQFSTHSLTCHSKKLAENQKIGHITHSLCDMTHFSIFGRTNNPLQPLSMLGFTVMACELLYILVGLLKPNPSTSSCPGRDAFFIFGHWIRSLCFDDRIL